MYDYLAEIYLKRARSSPLDYRIRRRRDSCCSHTLIQACSRNPVNNPLHLAHKVARKYNNHRGSLHTHATYLDYIFDLIVRHKYYKLFCFGSLQDFLFALPFLLQKIWFLSKVHSLKVLLCSKRETMDVKCVSYFFKSLRGYVYSRGYVYCFF